jgi:DNA repair exonuclease SbcCD ATPase subunit
MTPENQLAMTKAKRDAFKRDATNLSTIVTRLEADCVALRDQSHDIAEERDRLRVALKDAEARANNAETELAAAFARFESAVTTPVNNELRQRDLDARVMVDEQVRKLREQLTAMTDARDAAIDRATIMERDAAESRAKLDVLSAMFRAAISAVVRG